MEIGKPFCTLTIFLSGQTGLRSEQKRKFWNTKVRKAYYKQMKQKRNTCVQDMKAKFMRSSFEIALKSVSKSTFAP